MSFVQIYDRFCRFWVDAGRFLGGHVGVSQVCGRFLEIFGGLWTVFESHAGFYRLLQDFGGFWTILGEFWEAMLEPIWRPRRMKMGKTSILVLFLKASKRKAVSETILGPFSWRLEKQK